MRAKQLRLPAAAMAALSLVTMDSLALPIALGPIARSLHASEAAVLWAMIATCVTWSALVSIGCAARSRWGDRNVFTAGQLLLTVSCVGCAAAPNVGWLIAGRAGQGAATALIVPTAVIQLGESYGPRLRGALPTFAGGTAELAGVLGSLVCAGLVLGPGWRWVFWLNLPLCLASLALALAHRWSDQSPRRVLDPARTAVFALGSLAVLWGLMSGDRWGWTSAPVLACLVSGTVLLAVHAAARMPIGAFRARELTGYGLAYACGCATLFGLLYVLTAWFDGSSTPVASWCRLVPCFAGLLTCAPLSAAIARRNGAGRTVAVALGITAAGLTLLTVALRMNEPYPVLAVPLLLCGGGLGLALPSARRLSQNRHSLAPGQEHAQSVTVRMFAGALALATIGAVAGGRAIDESPGAQLNDTAAALIALTAICAAGCAGALLASGRGAARPEPVPTTTRLQFDAYGLPPVRSADPR